MKKYSANVLPVILLLAAMSMTPFSVLAHPGHDLMDLGAIHVVTSPFHLLMLALVGCLVWFAARFVKNRAPRRFMQATGVLALMGAAVLWVAGL